MKCRKHRKGLANKAIEKYSRNSKSDRFPKHSELTTSNKSQEQSLLDWRTDTSMTKLLQHATTGDSVATPLCRSRNTASGILAYVFPGTGQEQKRGRSRTDQSLDSLLFFRLNVPFGSRFINLYRVSFQLIFFSASFLFFSFFLFFFFLCNRPRRREIHFPPVCPGTIFFASRNLPREKFNIFNGNNDLVWIGDRALGTLLTSPGWFR